MTDTLDARLDRALLSLDGLSTGDAFGECFFPIALDEQRYPLYLSTRQLPNWRWRYTDDTEMAIAIVEVLRRHGRIDQDDLAATFAARYAADDRRGYGGGAHQFLSLINAGAPWREVAADLFDGQGSLGNGSATRVAPLGAFYADDVPTLVEQARLSAEVTHAHPEGEAGAIATAVAAAFAWNWRGSPPVEARDDFFDVILAHTPRSETRDGIERARGLPASESVERAAAALGNGSRVTCTDTIPFCVWAAARHFDSFPDAMWTTVSAGGDHDTNCAIVGGIVALSTREPLPAAWLAHREPLKFTPPPA